MVNISSQSHHAQYSKPLDIVIVHGTIYPWYVQNQYTNIPVSRKDYFSIIDISELVTSVFLVCPITYNTHNLVTFL